MNKRITKDEYYNHSLLPLKFGAVSLAHKTHSLIVPYAISGSYKFRGGDLVIRIGEAFSVDDDLEKAKKTYTYLKASEYCRQVYITDGGNGDERY